MDQTLLLAGLLSIVLVGCEGLQMNFHLGSSPSDGSREPCGVLTCLEEISHSPPDDASVTPGRLPSDITTGTQTISSLHIYRNYEDKPKGNEEILVAGVTSAEKNLSTATDHLTALGQLASTRASLRVELFLQKDCKATFTCQALTVDSNGKVHRSQLVSRAPGRHSDMNEKPFGDADHGNPNGRLTVNVGDFSRGLGKVSEQNDWTAEATLHLIGLVEQLSIKIATMEASVVGIRDRISPLEELKEQLSVMEGNLSNLDSIEDKINAMYYGKAALPVTPSEKISASVEEQEMVKLLVESSVCKNLSAITEELVKFKDSIPTNLHKSLESISRNMNANKDCPVGTGNNDKSVEERGNQINIYGLITNVSSSLSDSVKQDLSSFQRDLKENFKAIKSVGGNESNIFAQHSALVDTLYNLEPVVKNVINPASCEKDGLSIPFQKYFPYTVVEPDQQTEPLIQVPFLCETHTLGGGWLVIQRRSTGNVDFYRGWDDYRDGFGSLSDDFWLGLENIHKITTSGVYELRVDLQYNQKSAFAHYATFSIAGEEENYALLAGTYDGTAGDAFTEHRGMAFSTYDRDNDEWPNNCAVSFTGAWWYKACHVSNLNGKWQADGNKGPRWVHLSSDKAVSFSEMKVRRTH